MTMVADAPWIRDAEMNGDEETIEVECPVCGQRCETLFTNRQTNEVFGCECCIRIEDAYEWAEGRE